MLKTLDYINSLLTSNNRNVIGGLIDQEKFWDRVDRANLMITRLRTEDMNWNVPSVYLRGLGKFNTDLTSRNRSGEVEAFSRLYLAWCSIKTQTERYLPDEIDEWWLYRMQAAGDYIIEEVFNQLHTSDQHLLELELAKMHRAINSDNVYDIFTLCDNLAFLLDPKKNSHSHN